MIVLWLLLASVAGYLYGIATCRRVMRSRIDQAYNAGVDHAGEYLARNDW